MYFYLTQLNESRKDRLCWIIGNRYQDAYKDWDECRKVAEALEIITLDGRGEPLFHIRDNGNDQCSFHTIHGVKVETISAHDPRTIGREEPEILLLAECSLLEPEAWQRSFGRFDRKSDIGGRLYASGSYETNVGPFPDYVKLGEGSNALGVRSITAESWINPVVFPGGYDDPKLVRQRGLMSKERFWERFGAKPAPPALAVLPEFSVVSHVDSYLEYEPKAPTYIFVDPGDIVYSVNIVQIWEGEVRIMEQVYAHYSTHEAVISDVQSLEGYKYTHNSQEVVIDIAARARHANPESPEQIWRRRTGYTVSSRKILVEAKVDRLRTLLAINPATGRPRLRIHPRCTGIISEGGGCTSPVPNGGVWLRQSIGGPPARKHDHAWSGLGYGIIKLYGTSMPDTQYETPAGISYLDVDAVHSWI